MGRKSKCTVEEKISAVEDYLNGIRTISEIMRDLSIKSTRSVRDWIVAYQQRGVEALYPVTKNNCYTKNFKNEMVQRYLNGEGSVIDLCAQYGIPGHTTLQNWILRYNSHIELKDYDPIQEVYMAEARRKTAKEERIKIVDFCLNNNRNYKEAAQKYDVSYSQVYSWVKKYDELGEDGLNDKRGRHKLDNELDELERLRRENLRLKRKLEERDMAVELLKKTKEFERMCNQLGISRAAYYKWLNRAIPKQEEENIKLAELIKEYDERFGHILGYRRMTAWINHFNGTGYSKNRVHRIMKKLGIHSVIRKKRKKYKFSTPETTAENKLKRDFYASMPNEKWSTDVTEFKVPGKNKKLYLSAILDLYDKSTVSFVISYRNNNKLVFDTFDIAIANNPDAKPIFHSDRGFQYTSKIFKTKLERQEMEQSMSRVGHCIDNGPTEGLCGIVKSEMYCMFEIVDEESLIAAINGYMDFYNNERLQERFGCRTPLEVRQEALASSEPVQYPIPVNKRIQKYKEKWIA